MPELLEWNVKRKCEAALAEVRGSAKCAPHDILVIDSLASVLPSGYVEPV